jgi:hypothetical protein
MMAADGGDSIAGLIAMGMAIILNAGLYAMIGLFFSLAYSWILKRRAHQQDENQLFPPKESSQ